MLRNDGFSTSSENGGGSGDPSIDAIRMKNGICREDDVQKEYMSCSIFPTSTANTCVIDDDRVQYRRRYQTVICLDCGYKTVREDPRHTSQ